jgi:peptidoglycan DL-endopeptidase CwlO
MFPKNLFPHLLFSCLIFLCSVTIVSAQNSETRLRRVTVTQEQPVDQSIDSLENETNLKSSTSNSRLENDLIIFTEDEEEPATSEVPPIEITPGNSLEHILLSSITNKIGTPYSFGAIGPSRFDCSGFVWSVFQSAGISFSRSSARSLWQQFAPAREDEKFKFGTLVFFNNLGHVGIVADANGFYHASRRIGVTYSPFNKYWLSRLNGFRRVPLNLSDFKEIEQQSATKTQSKKQI